MADERLTAASYSRQSRGVRKSIEDQATENRQAAADNGWDLVAEYADGSSASRFARKARDDWARVLTAVDLHSFDVLILWESSRGDRDAASWLGLLATCRERAVGIYVVTHRRLYDMANPREWRTLAEDGVDNAYESEKIRERTVRGQRSAAAAGRPSQGRTPFGYQRHYDPRSGVLLGQEVDEETAPIVREVFRRVAAGEPVSSIAADLDRRGVPAPGGGWYRQRVLDLCHNVAYLGLRTYNGQQYEGTWEPLVDKALFWAADRVLADPTRRTTKPGRLRHLLSYLAVCDTCDGPLFAVRGRYRCQAGCVTIVQADTDEVVTRTVLARVGRPDFYRRLRSADEQADALAAEARAEADRLRGELQRARDHYARPGGISEDALAAKERTLEPLIRAAELRAQNAGIPPAVRALIEPGRDVRRRWEAMPLATRREAVKLLMSVRILPADVPGSRTFDPRRVRMVWR